MFVLQGPDARHGARNGRWKLTQEVFGIGAPNRLCPEIDLSGLHGSLSVQMKYSVKVCPVAILNLASQQTVKLFNFFWRCQSE